MPLESFRVEDAGAAIGARRQVMQMIEAIVMLLSWHASSLVALLMGAYIKENVCATGGLLLLTLVWLLVEWAIYKVSSFQFTRSTGLVLTLQSC